jgi:hypothetical protein
VRKGFVCHWNGPPVYTHGTDHRRCEAFWRAVKNYHMFTKGWSDIAYSWGVCWHGDWFEGRGWNQRQWANGEDQVGQDDGDDKDWYTVCCFLGEGEHPSAAMVQGVHELVAQARKMGRCGLAVLPHNAFKRKSCPGAEMSAWAAYWNNRPMADQSHKESVLLWL